MFKFKRCFLLATSVLRRTLHLVHRTLSILSNNILHFLVCTYSLLIIVATWQGGGSRATAIPEKEQRLRALCHVCARNRSLFSCFVLLFSSASLILTWSDLNLLRVTDDDRNNPCSVFPPAGRPAGARRGATHVSTCVCSKTMCEREREREREREDRDSCDSHASNAKI